MNEDWMTELEVRAGDELERRLDRYARLRLDPSAAQAKRARATVMEASWRQRLAGPVALDGAAAADPAGAAVATPSPKRHAPFAGWGARRVSASFAAAVLAGLLVGSTAFAASRAGGPLYDARITLEALVLPADAGARLEGEIALAQSRLSEIVEAAAKEDPEAVSAAVRGYLAALEGLQGEHGGPADRAFTAVQFHQAVLQEVLARVPAETRAGLERAIAASSKAMATLDEAGTDAVGPNGHGGGANGGTTNGGGNGGSGGNGTPVEKPAKTPDPQPAKTPAPARTPQPAKSAEPRPAKTPAAVEPGGAKPAASPATPEAPVAPEAPEGQGGQENQGSGAGQP